LRLIVRVCVLTCVLACLAVPAANASQIVSTSTGTNVKLGINAKGEAMVSYVSGGKQVHVLAYGAVNAIAPVRGKEQVALKLSYDGGYQLEYAQSRSAKAQIAKLRDLQDKMAQATASANNPLRYALKPKIAAMYAALAKLRETATNYWKTFTCPRYDGPAVAYQIAACKAPDGSYWALQSWDRDLPDYGVTPTKAQSQLEIHLAHWTGPLPQLDVNVDWAWGGQWNHFWGTYTYAGKGVYGFGSTSAGVPLDTFGRNLYVDTLDSAYGAGWRRENSFLMHGPLGSWCYSVNPHGAHPAGTGSQYRFSILGPGVTPDVSTTVDAPGPYDKAAQAPDNDALRALGDPLCKPH
jgi:hypothetical protein